MQATVCPGSTRAGGAAPTRPSLKVADLFRRHGEAYRAQHPLSRQQAKVLRSVETCRTAVLGGHLDKCRDCGFSKPSYNSCLDRHCPGCQPLEQARWIEKRQERILPVGHFHLVFTLPQELRAIAARNEREVYTLLFFAASETLKTLAAQRLGAVLGVTAVFHSWTRKMLFHPHLHCVVTAGGLSLDGQRWIESSPTYLFPYDVMGSMFRGIVLRRLKELHKDGRLVVTGDEGLLSPDDFTALLAPLYDIDWVVYAKPPFAGPDQVFRYLGRYTHRVAISDQRLESISDDAVCFRTRGGATTTITPEEFIRRFLLHILPSGFRKIRHYGLYAPASVNGKLVAARALLEPLDVEPTNPDEPWYDLLHRLTGDDPRACPKCKVGVLERFEIPALEGRARYRPRSRSPTWADTA